MASNYTGSPTASESPSPAPGLGLAPILSLPTTGDPRNVASILQPFKTLADWSAWLTATLGNYRGVTIWSNTDTYAVGVLVVDPTNLHLYRCCSSNTNQQPSASTDGTWKRIDYTADDIAYLTVQLITSTGPISCSHGATVSGAKMLMSASTGFSLVFFRVDNAPANGYTDIDLTGSGVAFLNATLGASATLAQTASSSIGQVGVALNSGSSFNVIRLMSNANYVVITPGGGSTYSCFIMAWGS